MQIELKLDKDFERTLDQLRVKYGESFEYINGVHPSQLDYSEFLSNFVKNDTLADTTIDPNANANHRDIRSFITEKDKASDKLFGLSKVFHEIKKQWGLRTAKAWLEQEYSKGFYCNDAWSVSLFPYCWANDLTRLATEGLFFLKGYNNQAPKHLTTYFDDVIEFTSFLSNRQSGAVGLPNVIIWAYYFWKKDVENGYYMKDPDYYLRQNFQKFIYRLNQPFMRIDQCSFTNVSVFDRCYIESLFGGVEFPDGSFVIDEIEEIMDCQKVFMEVVSEIRTSNMFTFPVLTTSLLYRDEKFQDEEFAKWSSDHNMKWSDSNFFISDNVGVLSNCPLKGDTKVLYWSDYYNEFKLSTIKELYFNMCRDNRDVVKVLSNGKLIDCKINKFNESADYKITLTNNASITTTANHLNKVFGRDYVKTIDLTTNDYLPISLTPYKSSDNLTYEDGKLVGMFIGDGSYKNNHEVTFSLNRITDADDIEFIEDYCPRHFNGKVTKCILNSSISDKDYCINVTVNSDYLRGLIEQFVIGDSALTKEINLRVLNCSEEFRNGIIDGWYTTDGTNGSRLSTSSKALVDSATILFVSLGKAVNVTEDDRDCRLGEHTNYTIRWYEPNNRTKLKDVYIIDDNYIWFKIKSIERTKKTDVAYCFEVIDESETPEFTLANGVVTHNCRLLSDTSKLDAFINSIGGTALSIGSCRVSTINLVRIAYEILDSVKDKEKAKDKYIKLLRDRVELDCKALASMRHILKRNIEKGLLPNYQDGALELDKQYCTIGIIGVYEVMDLFELIATDEFGYKSYTTDGLEFAKLILDTINDVKDTFECDFSFNVENIPGENCAGVICSADNLLFEKDNYYIYSNQWIPLKEKCTIQEKCRLGSELDKRCGGGQIAHIDIENRFATKEEAWDMLNYVASQGVIYSAFTTKINVCKDRHAFIGQSTCPVCGEPIADKYARVVGFYVPVSSYQKIRKREFNERKWYFNLAQDNIMV